jgi:hypothetical protein
MNNHKARKETPIYSGVHRYFPAALAGVSRVSLHGSRQHHGSDDLFDDRAKSNDDADCLLRHLADSLIGDGMDGDVPHIDKVAWRALRLSQKWHEARGALLAPAAANVGKVVYGEVVPHQIAAAYLRDVGERDDDLPNPVAQNTGD